MSEFPFTLRVAASGQNPVRAELHDRRFKTRPRASLILFHFDHSDAFAALVVLSGPEGLDMPV